MPETVGATTKSVLEGVRGPGMLHGLNRFGATIARLLKSDGVRSRLNDGMSLRATE